MVGPVAEVRRGSCAKLFILVQVQAGPPNFFTCISLRRDAAAQLPEVHTHPHQERVRERELAGFLNRDASDDDASDGEVPVKTRRSNNPEPL